MSAAQPHAVATVAITIGIGAILHTSNTGLKKSKIGIASTSPGI